MARKSALISSSTLEQGPEETSNGGAGLLFRMAHRLHGTGLQSNVNLPQIAVIGAQSAGKSSLIESIFGITLPRTSGTRCPVEFRLSRSKEPWKCTVSLRFITDAEAEGQSLGQERNETFGDVIYNKQDVEERIRRAQFAILNPQKSTQDLLDPNFSKFNLADSELDFSSNAVSLEISGPGVADLSFVDLPGLIESVSSGNMNKKSNDNSTLTQSITATYIKQLNCIILLTVSCETDFVNQGAHSLATCYDPLGKRTIGVLTNPDRIPKGEEANWLPFLRNEKEALENSWFCVKQPSSRDLKEKVTWDTAREKENAFFSKTSPWRKLTPQYQSQLRTANLVEKLNAILSDMVLKRAHEILKEIDASIQSCRTSLSLLPDSPPADPQSEITSMLNNFVSDLSLYVEGHPLADEDGWLQSIRPAQERFKHLIRSTAPNFVTVESSNEDKQHFKKAAFLLEEEDRFPVDEEDGGSYENDRNDKGDDDSSGTKDEIQEVVVPPRSSTKRKEHPDNKTYIDEVVAWDKIARARELPGNFPYAFQRTVIGVIVKSWETHALGLCATVYRHISELLKRLVSKHFKHFGRGLLEQRLKAIMQKYVEECKANAEVKVLWLLDAEKDPFSLKNTPHLSAYKEKYLAYYRGERQRYTKSKLISSDPKDQVLIDKALRSLAKLGVTGIDKADLQKLIPADEMEPALQLMADVQAYLLAASERSTNILPLTIEHELLRGVANDAMKKISEDLGINSVDGYQISAELAEECPEVRVRRVDLAKKIKRLEKAQRHFLRRLETFP